jgi:translation elongation factor EF-Tu-like GTPase
MDDSGPALWMSVVDVLGIKDRGVVVIGRLEGNGQLSVGDFLLYDGGRWRVDGIEQSRSALMSASPGSKIGLLLADGPPRDMLRGRTVQFETNGPPQMGAR